MTLSDLFKRTTECGDCLLWTGSFVHGVAPVVSIKNKKIYVKRFILELEGKNIAGKCVSYTCGQESCVNPKHLVIKTKAQVIKTTAATGVFSTNAVRSKVAAGKRKGSKLSQAAAIEIRTSNVSVQELAAKHGITASYGYMIRRGEFRRDYSNPFSGLIA
jgi:hypothetical protein